MKIITTAAKRTQSDVAKMSVRRVMKQFVTVIALVLVTVFSNAGFGGQKAHAQTVNGPVLQYISTDKSATNGGEIVLTLHFDKAPNTIVGGGIVVQNGSVDFHTFGSTTLTSRAKIRPTGTSDMIVSLNAGTVFDAANNPNPASTYTLTIPYDAVAPTVTLSPDYPDVSSTAEFDTTITFSEPVTGFTQSDVVVTKGSITKFSVISDVYFVGITPDGTGDIQVSVPSGAAQDGAGNDSVASTPLTVTYDTTPPRIVSATPNVTTHDGSSSIEWSIVFSKSGVNWDTRVSNFDITNGTIAFWGSTGTTAGSIGVTPTGSGAVSLQFLAGAFYDRSGVRSVLDTNILTIQGPDTTAPTVSVTGQPASYTGTIPFDVSVVFSEAVTGFVASDIVVANASVSGIAGSGATYTATIQPTGSGDIDVSVPAAVATDAAGNSNLASTAVQVLTTNVEITKQKIASFITSRSTNLIGNQPNLIGFVTGDISGNFRAQASQNKLNFDVQSKAGRPVWFMLQGNKTKNQGADSTYVFGAIGAHRQVSENVHIGAMAEFDHVDGTSGAATTSGTGWLIGPYIVARHATQPLFFDARLLYGRSSNKASPLGTYNDSFKTERFLGQVSMRGKVERKRLTLFPTLRASHVTDRQQAYVNGLSAVIPAQNIGVTEVSAGLDFAMPMAVQTGEMTLTGGVSALFSETTGTSIVSGTDGGRMRLDIGLERKPSENARISVSSFYDGIGANGFKSYGLTFGLSMDF